MSSDLIPIMEPDLSGNEKAYLNKALDSGWISSKGEFITLFEERLCDYNAANHCLVVSNGTVALHLAIVALGIGPGDEVIVPNLTFAASINAILHAGATPVIVDVDEATFNIDPALVKPLINSRTKAVMCVHLYGNPCDLSSLQALCESHGLFLIEDAAEALGSTYQGKKAGSIGHVGTFSFYGNKTITTGEGGAILFKNSDTYEYAKRLRDHGMSTAKRYWHDEVGFNYRMTNMQAAIGCSQLERVEEFLQRKREIAHSYQEMILSLDNLEGQNVLHDCEHSFWLFVLLADDKAAELTDHLLQRGVETRPVFFPMNQMEIYRRYASTDCAISHKLSEKGICLPSFPKLTDPQLDHIIQSITSFYE